MTEPIEPEAAGYLGTVLWDDAHTVAYRLESFLGGGGMSLTYLATRRSSDSEGRAVVKLMRPSFLRSASHAATLAMRKEGEALRRLNARTPPNPFIVRLIDVSALRVGAVEVPWLALEYVHGGPEGTTLGDRVACAIQETGCAFDPARVARVMEQLRSALADVHAAGIVHRDLKPENVLVCGAGIDEIFKVADFGIARSSSMEATFGVGVGTQGYAAPEQLGADPTRIGPWTDVFGLAATMFHAIAGVDAFDTSKPRRRLRSLLESPYLSAELRARPSTLHALDDLFARALSSRIEDRPQTAHLFAAALLGTLAVDARPLPTNLPARRRTIATRHDEAFRWSIAHRPVAERVIRGVAWNSDGRCLAATGDGLSFWNGERWSDVPVGDGALRSGLRLVRRVGPGAWLVGGDQATLALFGPHGLEEVLQGPDPTYSIQLVSGELDDLAVFVFGKPDEAPTLYALSHGRWLKPLTLDGVSSVNAIARLADAEWFVAGRKSSGEAFAAHYLPLFWEIREVEVPAGTILACDARAESGVVLAGTVDGVVFSLCEGEWSRAELVGRPAIAAVALDPLQRAWLGTAGRLWLGFPERRTPYVPVWSGDGVPIVSIYADASVVFAMTADGAIVEGRPERA
jgi:serine/threonine protein kinase